MEPIRHKYTVDTYFYDRFNDRVDDFLADNVTAITKFSEPEPKLNLWLLVIRACGAIFTSC